ncbi:MAG: tetratricopeptide repeat protein [Thermotogae bacterium]|nr:tetratricopeptide repeat protein [Thermotogota bacterium]
MEVESVLEEVKFYVLNRRYEEAERLLKKALDERPNDEELLYNLGLVYEMRSKEEEASEIYRRIIELHPEGKRREDALNRLRKLERPL